MAYKEDKHKYDDMLYLPHPVSKAHPPMRIQERAAQFAPFAALAGYGEAVRETERPTDGQVELDENCLALLDAKLQILCGHLQEQPEVSIVYFKPDEKKAGGSYIEITGNVKRVDACSGSLALADGAVVPIEGIRKIDGAVFDQYALPL